MAYPFIEGAYVAQYELNDKVELLLSAPVRTGRSARSFSRPCMRKRSRLTRMGSEPPALPPEVVTIRQNAPTRNQRLRHMARNVRAIEGYAALSAGRQCALFIEYIQGSLRRRIGRATERYYDGSCAPRGDLR